MMVILRCRFFGIGSSVSRVHRGKNNDERGGLRGKARIAPSGRGSTSRYCEIRFVGLARCVGASPGRTRASEYAPEPTKRIEPSPAPARFTYRRTPIASTDASRSITPPLPTVSAKSAFRSFCSATRGGALLHHHAAAQHDQGTSKHQQLGLQRDRRRGRQLFGATRAC